MALNIREPRQATLQCGRTARKRKKDKQKWPKVCSQDREMVELRKWMKKTAGFRSSLVPAIFHETGRGLMTKNCVSPGDIIISLPKALLITMETMLNSQVGEHVKRWIPKLTPQEALSVFIIWEKSRTSLSPWQPYLSSLPKYFTTPGYFTDTELSLLPLTVYAKCAKELKKIKHSYDKIFEYSKTRWTEFHRLLTFKDFTWTFYVINTRSVYIKRPKSQFLSTEEDDHLALAPFLDLLNHSLMANVLAGFNEASGYYEIRTFDNYKKHDQVFISYGHHDNQKLFIDYGFCLPDNSNDVYEFSFDELLDLCKEFNIQYTDKKFKILRENKLLQSLCCSVEGVSWNLWTTLKTLSMTWCQMQAWSDVYISGHDEAEFVAMATAMAKSLIGRALQKNQEGMNKFLQVDSQNLNPDHVRLARTLLEIEENILKQSLRLLG